MTFSERMKEFIDQGLTASKDFVSKAGAKAQDLGERGILMLEIKQLEGQAQKLLSRLGNEVYQAFAERNEDSIGRDTAEVGELLSKLSGLRETIEQKEADLKSKKI